MLCPVCKMEIDAPSLANHMTKDHGVPVMDQPMPPSSVRASTHDAGKMTKVTVDLDRVGANPPPIFTPETIPVSKNATNSLNAPNTGKVIPPRLVYKYEGTCSEGHSLSTLEMDVAKKHVVVAFCAACNKQVETREVIDLTKEQK